MGSGRTTQAHPSRGACLEFEYLLDWADLLLYLKGWRVGEREQSLLLGNFTLPTNLALVAKLFGPKWLRVGMKETRVLYVTCKVPDGFYSITGIAKSDLSTILVFFELGLRDAEAQPPRRRQGDRGARARGKRLLARVL